ncbi:MAG: type I-U CRISPR-associated RAMP protein Csb1/Cas7u [Acidimicrobiales bacterium]
MSDLSYEDLLEAVSGGAVAFRSSVRLEPAGGPGTKVMPPTYGVADNAPHKYAIESRVMPDGTTSLTVLLDSVASQANRMEMALLSAWETSQTDLPVPFVDFTGEADLADVGKLTALEAPHRIADAIFRDSLYDETLFRLSDLGMAITHATPKNAIALLRTCPTALVFGMWDSTGPKGGLGSKFQRALVSEIVGHDVEVGVSVGSRVDPLDVRRGVDGITKLPDDDPSVWAFDEDSKKQVRPSEINHGNVTPSIDERAGGVTISHASQSAVLSFPALRRLKFPVDADGNPFEPEQRQAAENAARTLIAAIGVAAVSLQYEFDFDLRSRCLLIPASSPTMEMLGRSGGSPVPVHIDADAALELVATANAAATELGVGFGPREVRLVPAPKLGELLRRSRQVAAAENPGE